MLIKELKILSEALWEAVKTDLKFFSSVGSFVKKLSDFNYSELDKDNLNEIKVFTDNIEHFFNAYRSTRDGYSFNVPPRISRNDQTVIRINEIISQLDNMNEEDLTNEVGLLKPNKIAKKNLKGGKVFIGHGRSKLWARVQLMLTDDLNIETITFESESRTSESIIQILEEFLASSSFAILILTAEDETTEGTIRARQNVIHEAGLFQGRLGFDRVVLLKQNNAEGLSNLAGLQYIPFDGENIEQTFYELHRKLKKSGVVK